MAQCNVKPFLGVTVTGYFYKSSFENFHVYGKQLNDKILKNDLVLNHGGALDLLTSLFL